MEELEAAMEWIARVGGWVNVDSYEESLQACFRTFADAEHFIEECRRRNLNFDGIYSRPSESERWKATLKNIHCWWVRFS